MIFQYCSHHFFLYYISYVCCVFLWSCGVSVLRLLLCGASFRRGTIKKSTFFPVPTVDRYGTQPRTKFRGDHPH